MADSQSVDASSTLVPLTICHVSLKVERASHKGEGIGSNPICGTKRHFLSSSICFMIVLFDGEVKYTAKHKLNLWVGSSVGRAKD